MNNPVVGLTSGTFDLFHWGHLKYLWECEKLCDKLIVAVDCDEMVKKIKGKGNPIYPARERRLIVDALECVHLACIIDSLDDLKRISQAFHVDKVFKNKTFAKSPTVFGVNECPAELIVIPDVGGLPETADVIQTIKSRFGDTESITLS